MPSSLFWLAALWWIVSGVTFSTGNAPLIALIQSQVPNQLQGRVLSLLSTVMGLAAPLGLGLAALLGAFIGVRGSFIVGGLASATICLLGLALPDLLRIEEQPLRAERTHAVHVNLADRR
ncbi:MFS transporter [Candidatus Chloroploca sp. Khr17]|uniref:MFS transporter n=1 Tax=Candidatus Chloroploca sp. Khr17 TaxID=2496869 RepID=UPI00196B908B|nr:MFS transporter [Candidatus Chloroploca sp. Khr17]